MWLGLIAFILLVVGIVGSVLSGGIFLIILVPLGVIAAVTAIVTRGSAEAAGPKRPPRPKPTPQGPREETPLPHSLPADPASRQPVTPDQQLEARLRQ
jgi:hypothetical protein